MITKEQFMPKFLKRIETALLENLTNECAERKMLWDAKGIIVETIDKMVRDKEGKYAEKGYDDSFNTRTCGD